VMMDLNNKIGPVTITPTAHGSPNNLRRIVEGCPGQRGGEWSQHFTAL